MNNNDDGTYLKGVEYYLNSIKTAIDTAKEALGSAVEELDPTEHSKAKDLIAEALTALEEIKD